MRRDELEEWRLCAMVVMRDALRRRWAEQQGLPPPKTYLQELQEFVDKHAATSDQHGDQDFAHGGQGMDGSADSEGVANSDEYGADVSFVSYHDEDPCQQ